MLSLGLIAVLAWLWLLLWHGGGLGGFWRIHPPSRYPAPKLWPSVVAVVPARNEAAVIAHAVKSLLRQDYPGDFHVVVVDDNSTDDTATIARDAAALLGASDRLSVITGSPLPTGWVGKVWAMEQGLQAANRLSPTYVLFSDADIWHGTSALCGVVSEAEAGALALTSRMVRLRVENCPERWIIPAFVYFFRLLYPFEQVAKPTSSVAGAAGGCMLVQRAALRAAGDMAAIKGALIDDCALARLLKDHGGRLALRLGDDSQSIRPYEGMGELWLMIARSAYTQLRASPLLLAGSLAGLALLFLAPSGAVLMGIMTATPSLMLLGLAAWAMMAATYAPMLRYYRQPLWHGVALPVVAAFYMAATLDSARRHYSGTGGAWKGRVHTQGSGLGDRGSARYSSGKDKGDENFPVGSWLIAKPLRRHVHAFYRFARQADDVADSATVSPQEKLHQLDMMAAVLVGEGDDSQAPAAAALRRSLAETGVPNTHALELLQAFRQDARQTRYADFASLMAYCRLSAAPVGRYLLDLHGEDHATWPASDALCAALQIINHLQDCGDDYRTINRVYIPEDLLQAAGLTVEALARPAASPALRGVLDQVIALTAPLVATAQTLAPGVKNVGLRRESAVIAALAERLLVTVRRRDPLATRATLGLWGIMAGTVTGLWRSRHTATPLQAHIEGIVRRSGTSFYHGMRMLSRPQQHAMYAVYAFCRVVDDIADNPAPMADKRAGLERWRAEIAALYAGTATDPIAVALKEVIAPYGLRQEDFLAVIDGCAMDADEGGFHPDWATLTLYCDRVAGAVGRLSVNIFGAGGPEGVAVANALGRALQLTNILRDVREDAAMGRLYLPSEVLLAHGITSRDPLVIADHPALAAVCQTVGEDAQRAFAQAYRAMAACPRPAMRPARLMAASYHALLHKIAAQGWRPSHPVIKVNKFVKLWFVLRHGLV